MKHTQREKQRAKKTLHNHCRYTAGRLQLLHQGHESVFVGGRLSALLPPPAVGKSFCMVAGLGFLPLRTHTPLSEGRKSFVPAGRSRNWLINSNVYQNIHCVGESAKLQAAQKTGTKDLQDEQDVCRHRRQAEAAKLSGDHRQKWEGHR